MPDLIVCSHERNKLILVKNITPLVVLVILRDIVDHISRLEEAPYARKEQFALGTLDAVTASPSVLVVFRSPHAEYSGSSRHVWCFHSSGSDPQLCRGRPTGSAQASKHLAVGTERCTCDAGDAAVESVAPRSVNVRGCTQLDLDSRVYGERLQVKYCERQWVYSIPRRITNRAKHATCSSFTDLLG